MIEQVKQIFMYVTYLTDRHWNFSERQKANRSKAHMQEQMSESEVFLPAPW